MSILPIPKEKPSVPPSIHLTKDDSMSNDSSASKEVSSPFIGHFPGGIKVRAAEQLSKSVDAVFATMPTTEEMDKMPAAEFAETFLSMGDVTSGVRAEMPEEQKSKLLAAFEGQLISAGDVAYPNVDILFGSGEEFTLYLPLDVVASLGSALYKKVSILFFTE